MIPEPFFQFATQFGVEDRILALFMLAGPPVILAIMLVGRTRIITIIATAYVGLFVLYIASKGIIADEE